MATRSEEILRALDACAKDFSFPALDNGYVYLASTRLSVFRSSEDWALVIEVFGFSPREGTPSTSIQTFASRLHDRDPPESYASPQGYANYLAHNPYNEFRSVFPFGRIDLADSERVASEATDVWLRGRSIPLPGRSTYGQYGIELLEADGVRVFEACRYFAAVARDDVLATSAERRVSVRPEMKQLLQLDEWHHPDIVGDEPPSRSRTFRQLAQVLESGDPSAYAPTEPPNTHWQNWPEGGTL